MQGRFAAANNSPETTFIDSVNRSLWLAVLLAGLVALLLALIFAHTILRPLHTLKVVTRKMEQGDLSQRVFIKSKGEVGALAHAFNAMADSLSRSERLRRNLVSDVAHELRNPLMNIRGYLELLQDQVLEPTPETLASLYEETSLLNRLVADLQDLSLAEAGQLHLDRQPVDLAEVASQAVQIVQPHLVQKNLTLHVHLPSHLPRVTADQERIAQVLRNLLSNAIRHTPEQGKIWLKPSAMSRCSGSACEIAGWASRPNTSPISLNASIAPMPRVPARPAAAGWAWQSPDRLCRRMVARSPSKVSLDRAVVLRLRSPLFPRALVSLPLRKRAYPLSNIRKRFQ